ncbi:hypothetical protein [Candidatus Poriferisocius sp.]|uniref:hypothetical protein n=1 Tax=Candidatus Poriferisocius sp. TaxID=3101276 RepID=UPI003B0239AD
MVPPPPPPTPDPTASGFVLEHPEIPSQIEARILANEYWAINVLPSHQVSDQEPFVNKISCDKPASIAYLQDLITQTTSSEESELDGATLDSIGRHAWFVPWKAGFLQVGYPKVIDPCEVEIQSGIGAWTVWWFPSMHGVPYLLERRSPDGIDWTTPERLSLPVDAPPLAIYGGEAFSPPLVLTTNGDILLVGIQQEGSALVSITRDLVEWETSEVPFHRPERLHPRLEVSADLENIALGPNGWIVGVTVTALINMWILVPDDIFQEAVRIGSPLESQEGMFITWYLEDGGSNTRLVPWEELGIDGDIFQQYGSDLYSNKPYLQSPNFSGWVWPHIWGTDVPNVNTENWIELPYISRKICCEIIGTGDGYIALTIPYMAGYSPLWSGYQRMFFSRNGYEWEEIETPEETRSREDSEETPIFLWSLRKIGELIFVSGVDEQVMEDGSVNRWWVIDPDGTNWRRLESTQYAYMDEWLDGWARVVANGDVAIIQHHDGTFERHQLPTP